MNTLLRAFVLLFLSFTALPAQTWVTIPDANFVTFLQTNYPTCMNGNQMDITCPQITSATIVNVENKAIADLSGIEHFTSLALLFGYNNQLTTLPSPLPATLVNLSCGANPITSLPPLPAGLLILNISNTQLPTIPTLPAGLQSLYAGGVSWPSIPSLPASLLNLDLQQTGLNAVPPLPAGLELLYVNNNPGITSIPSLPAGLKTLACSQTGITALPPLPATLQELVCADAAIGSLPATLPPGMISLYADNCGLTTLPPLPAGFINLTVSHNQLTSLPSLPAGITYVDVNNNALTSLPPLPSSISYLVAHHNQISFLPPLSNAGYISVDCSNNLLTSLGGFGTAFNGYLNVNHNQIMCFPTFPPSMTVDALNNPFTCYPNYTGFMNPTAATIPLCQDNDPVNNPGACASAAGISGKIYEDVNANCVADGGDVALQHAGLRMYDSGGAFVSYTATVQPGPYFLPAAAGTWTVELDTAGKPYRVNCAYPGTDTTVSLTGAAPLALNVNFETGCKPGFEIGTHAAYTQGWVFPGQIHTLHLEAGDLSHLYNLNCAAGVSGQVQVTLNGPVTYAGAPAGALTPAVAGNVLTFTVADFGTSHIFSDFNLLLRTDTTAQAGDTVCISVNVTPVAGDNAPVNNSFSFCYPVLNSYDPNHKDVYPAVLAPLSTDWLTYTLQFQNTGSAPAFNIRLKDTLDSRLDMESFQFLTASHAVNVSLVSGVLTLTFPNILLPDSLSDPAGSQGMAQFRIRPLAGMQAGTQIPNKVSIYFDFNAPIVTNTATVDFRNTVARDPAAVKDPIRIAPNPSQGLYAVSLPEGAGMVSWRVTDLAGRTLLHGQSGNAFALDLRSLSAGMYLFRAESASGTQSIRLVKE